ncbi:OLC1v1034777C1 [Oldenlandia corymbosa var. corymbosa]|uniref:Histone H2A n=1 Tax=Oldenlandia corymbosa var. corymbosa TaxID=529605 RepID=A0AAV1CS43_OLDCO|nr:OLC1v1034777C1 [Oldenlandia corymbosa var. corymbosa]
MDRLFQWRKMESGKALAGADQAGNGGPAKGPGPSAAGAGRAKGAGGRTGSAGRKNVTRSKKAGLVFPVERIGRFLKKGGYADRIGSGAPVYMDAVLEYMAAELLELAGNAARDNKKLRITPRHLKLAVGKDEELDTLLKGVDFRWSGVVPHIHKVLVPNKDRDSQELEEGKVK